MKNLLYSGSLVLLALFVVVPSINVNADESPGRSELKAKLVKTIEKEHIWLYSDAVDKTAMINVSDSLRAAMFDKSKKPTGYSTLKRTGKAFVDLSDKFRGTTLEKQCGFGVNTVEARKNQEHCKEAIDAWQDNYTLTLSARDVEASRDSFKMVLGYVSSVAIFLEDGSASLWHHGYVPKADSLHLVINADKKFTTVDTSWSDDNKTFTIDAPADIETAGWNGKIGEGLKAG